MSKFESGKNKYKMPNIMAAKPNSPCQHEGTMRQLSTVYETVLLKTVNETPVAKQLSILRPDLKKLPFSTTLNQVLSFTFAEAYNDLLNPYKMAKILVIDDTLDHLDMLKMMLQLQQHTIKTAPTQETALALLESFQPDIILLDVFLRGGVSGRELCKAIKESHPEILIILLSADQKSLKDFKLCGADGIIEKPFDIETLFETIDSLMKLQ